MPKILYCDDAKGIQVKRQQFDPVKLNERWKTYCQWEAGKSDPILLPDGRILTARKEKSDAILLRRVWIDMAGDHALGIMLAQIVYWAMKPGKNGMLKLMIENDNRRWLAKSATDWWNECRLTPSQVKRGLTTFQRRGWIITKVLHFQGKPTTHIRLMYWEFLQDWEKTLDNPPTSPVESNTRRVRRRGNPKLAPVVDPAVEDNPPRLRNRQGQFMSQ